MRFAAREALFKALSHAIPNHQIPFLKLCKATKIIKNEKGVPLITINWQLIDCASLTHCSIWISLTHTKTTASALVILENN